MVKIAVAPSHPKKPDKPSALPRARQPFRVRVLTSPPTLLSQLYPTVAAINDNWPRRYAPDNQFPLPAIFRLARTKMKPVKVYSYVSQNLVKKILPTQKTGPAAGGQVGFRRIQVLLQREAIDFGKKSVVGYGLIRVRKCR